MSVFVVHAERQLSAENRQAFRHVLMNELDRGERNFIIDFTQTVFIDSSGLGLLVSLSKKIRAQGGELRLTKLNAELTELFRLTKLGALFRLDDEDDGSAGTGVRAPLRPPPRAGGAEEPLR
jgi:anti-sigma B factor antagonist